MANPKLPHGTIVSYVYPSGPIKGQARPALLIDHQPDEGPGTADLWVFPNPKTDATPNYSTIYPFYVGAAPFDAQGKPGTWSH
jgi:hypothetical protein